MTKKKKATKPRAKKKTDGTALILAARLALCIDDIGRTLAAINTQLQQLQPPGTCDTPPCDPPAVPVAEQDAPQ